MVSIGLSCYTLRMAYPIDHRGTVDERFWAKVITDTAAAECWEWQGAKDKKGYGRFRVSPDVGTKLAHHVSLWLTNGDWPEGVVMHTCDNSSCVRPDHLVPNSTIADNNRDMIIKGRGNNQQKTHCPQGHPYDNENTLINDRGHRRCLECKRDEGRRYQARIRQERKNASI